MTQIPVHMSASTGQSAKQPTRKRPQPCVVVIFGITGDLARRKLVPALYHLARQDSLPERLGVLGVSRSVGSKSELRTRLRESLGSFSRSNGVDETLWKRFAGDLLALAGDLSQETTYLRLRERLAALDGELGTACNRLFYLATPPSAFAPVLRGLSQAALLRPQAPGADGGCWSRVIVEKPFGQDLASARELNRLCLEVADESQIYRIDHYLGKETVQNLLVFRFGNAIFEPLWNRNHIDHVQITMAESLGVEGRGHFYEQVGVVRDVVQNHLLQVLALVAMEPPVSFEAEEIRNMKAQALRSLRPLAGSVQHNMVAAQYEGYRAEAGVAADSRTPTYLACTAYIDNWRWQGVPFHLRAGKALAARMTEISFHFRTIPFCLFGEEQVCQRIEPNVLRLRIQPDEGISLSFAGKVPGDTIELGRLNMDFRYAQGFDTEVPEAYERLLLDCMRGDATLFARRDEVELSWAWLQPVLDALRPGPGDALPIYAQGGQGPEEANELLRRQASFWETLR